MGAAGAATLAIANSPDGTNSSAPSTDVPDASLSDALDAYERRLIAAALAATSGNVAEAARRLQTDRPNLYRRMRRLGLAVSGE
jgi:transcriptional regulator with GAF, ATPase, and Fis domain